MAKASTITEVARLAGVSVTTASKAVNGRTKISEATRERVLAAARQLDYHPNPLARSLHSGRSGTVGVVLVSTSMHRFAVPLLLGIEAGLAEIDLSLTLSDARGDEARVQELARTLRHRKVDGLIVVGDNNAVTPAVDAGRVPVVYVHGCTARVEDVAHAPDDRGGAALAVDHLVATGRRRVAHLAGPRGTRAADERAGGVAEALARHGLELTTSARYGPWSQRWGRAATAELLAEQPGLDAIVCGSDQIATGALAALEAVGRRVPDDVAVTGHDNLPILAQESDPPLTSVDMNLEELGATAARRLFEIIDGRPQHGLVLQPATLVVRGSTGGAPADHRPAGA